jgi:hypothetical protein
MEEKTVCSATLLFRVYLKVKIWFVRTFIITLKLGCKIENACGNSALSPVANVIFLLVENMWTRAPHFHLNLFIASSSALKIWNKKGKKKNGYPLVEKTVNSPDIPFCLVKYLYHTLLLRVFHVQESGTLNIIDTDEQRNWRFSFIPDKLHD